jgi:hypothetical protein
MPWLSLPGGHMPVGATIPTGFEAYARVLHPAYRTTDGHQALVRWTELAERAGVVPHAELQWEELASGAGPGDVAPMDAPPQEGHLPAEEAAALVDVLRRHTATPDRCWFAVWDGFGGLEPEVRWPGATRLHLPHRDYVLLRGSIDAATGSFCPAPFRQSANLWWPEDRAWCVATEIDYLWTYVGATEPCLEELLAEPRLEILRTRPDHRASSQVAHRDAR